MRLARYGAGVPAELKGREHSVPSHQLCVIWLLVWPKARVELGVVEPIEGRAPGGDDELDVITCYETLEDVEDLATSPRFYEGKIEVGEDIGARLQPRRLISVEA